MSTYCEIGLVTGRGAYVDMGGWQNFGELEEFMDRQGFAEDPKDKDRLVIGPEWVDMTAKGLRPLLSALMEAPSEEWLSEHGSLKDLKDGGYITQRQLQEARKSMYAYLGEDFDDAATWGALRKLEEFALSVEALSAMSGQLPDSDGASLFVWTPDPGSRRTAL